MLRRTIIMKSEKVNGSISKAKDNSFKAIFDEPLLFAQLIRDFVDIDILKDIGPEDIEDVSERYLPLFEEEKDSDTVKKIKLEGDTPLFVIAILEHESKVNFRTPFKMLLYISLVLDAYEKDCEKESRGCTRRKGFKYPPVLPIVFYDGKTGWSAERGLVRKTELGDVFEKYIPKFEYELVDLTKYSLEDIQSFGDALSLILSIDKCSSAGRFNLAKELPAEYLERLSPNIPDSLRKLLSDVIRVMLTKVNLPKDEVDEFAGLVHERSVAAMFEPWEKIDIQEIRRTSRAEGVAEGETKGETRGIAKVVRRMLAKNKSVDEIADDTGFSVDEILSLKGSF
jgi:hypothetical protein